MALKEHDQKQLFFARQHILDIRNVYASLTDMMHKNISKVNFLVVSHERIADSLAPASDTQAEGKQQYKFILAASPYTLKVLKILNPS